MCGRPWTAAASLRDAALVGSSEDAKEKRRREDLPPRSKTSARLTQR